MMNLRRIILTIVGTFFTASSLHGMDALVVLDERGPEENRGLFTVIDHALADKYKEESVGDIEGVVGCETAKEPWKEHLEEHYKIDDLKASIQYEQLAKQWLKEQIDSSISPILFCWHTTRKNRDGKDVVVDDKGMLYNKLIDKFGRGRLADLFYGERLRSIKSEGGQLGHVALAWYDPEACDDEEGIQEAGYCYASVWPDREIGNKGPAIFRNFLEDLAIKNRLPDMMKKNIKSRGCGFGIWSMNVSLHGWQITDWDIERLTNIFAGMRAANLKFEVKGREGGYSCSTAVLELIINSIVTESYSKGLYRNLKYLLGNYVPFGKRMLGSSSSEDDKFIESIALLAGMKRLENSSSEDIKFIDPVLTLVSLELGAVIDVMNGILYIAPQLIEDYSRQGRAITPYYMAHLFKESQLKNIGYIFEDSDT